METMSWMHYPSQGLARLGLKFRNGPMDLDSQTIPSMESPGCLTILAAFLCWMDDGATGADWAVPDFPNGIKAAHSGFTGPEVLSTLSFRARLVYTATLK